MTINDIISAYIESKQAETAAKKQAEMMKKLIVEHAGNSDNFTTDKYTVILKTTTSTRLDTKALYSDFPDIKDTYGKTSTSVSVDAVETAKTGKKSA